MPSSADLTKQLNKWLAEISKDGRYEVTRNGHIYKINRAGGGLIMTVPAHPRGAQLKQVMKKAERQGIVAAERQRGGGGQPPPEVAHIPVPKNAPQQTAPQEPVAKEEKQVARKEQARPGRGPNSAKRIEAATQIRNRVLEWLEALGGNNNQNRKTLVAHGIALAKKEGRPYPGRGAQHPDTTAEMHIRNFANGKTESLWKDVEEFWLKTLADLDRSGLKDAQPAKPAQTAKPVEEPKREPEAPSDITDEELDEMGVPPEKPGRGIEDTGDEEGMAEVISVLRAELAKANKAIADNVRLLSDRAERISRLTRTGEQLANDKARLESLNSRQAADLDRIMGANEELQAQVQELRSRVSSQPSPINDELSVTVLRRMLLLAFPDDEKKVEEAIDIAVQVANR